MSLFSFNARGIFPVNFLLILLTVFILIIALILSIFPSQSKGFIGEAYFYYLAKKYLSDDYVVMSNLTFKVGENDTTQIDHIIVSRFGVFVVEVKNFKGWIFGSINQKKWTQQIYRNKYRFQNPAHQNIKHIRAVENILNEAIHDKIYSLVVFISNTCEIKTDLPDFITTRESWLSYVLSKNNPIFTKSQVEDMVKLLNNHAMEKSFKTHMEHINNIKKLNKFK